MPGSRPAQARQSPRSVSGGLGLRRRSSGSPSRGPGSWSLSTRGRGLSGPGRFRAGPKPRLGGASLATPTLWGGDSEPWAPGRGDSPEHRHNQKEFPLRGGRGGQGVVGPSSTADPVCQMQRGNLLLTPGLAFFPRPIRTFAEFAHGVLERALTFPFASDRKAGFRYGSGTLTDTSTPGPIPRRGGYGLIRPCRASRTAR